MTDKEIRTLLIVGVIQRARIEIICRRWDRELNEIMRPLVMDHEPIYLIGGNEGA